MNARRFAQAEALARRVVQKSPQDGVAAFVLGAALKAQGRNDQALHHLERAVRLAPWSAEHWSAFAEAAVEAGRFDDGEQALRRCLELNPGHVLAHVQQADLLLMSGRPEEAELAARETVRIAPENFFHAVTRATFTCYSSRCTPAERFAAHRAAAAGAEQAFRPPIPPLDTSAAGFRDPERPLRIAYLSPDFLTHSVSYFFEPILEHGTRNAFLSHCYFASERSDATTARLRSLAAGWRTLPKPTEQAIAQHLREDRIDIAIDLAGFTNSSIIWPLRQRITPIQGTYLGYPHSTTMANIDVRFVDSLTDPREGPFAADHLATERLIRLDPCFLCYRMPPAPEVDSPDPAGRAGPITFGSFNLMGKQGEAARRAWKQVLDAAPGSRLLLKDGAFEHEQGRARWRRTLEASGIDPARATLLAKTKTRDDHLALYGQVDIALDPFPYNGTTTTCEALMMGVPVITVAGDSHASRVGVSLLSAAGLPELIASDEGEYVRIAADLAADRPRLAALRAGLRARLAASPLCNGPAFARRWEETLRGLWREWCAGQAP